MRQIFILALSILLNGCASEDFEDLHEFVENSGADMRGKIDPPPEVKAYEYFAYVNDEGLPSPFSPRKEASRDAGVKGGNQPDLDRPKEALEEFPLESLKMVGYLYRSKVGYGVVRSPDGKLHRVKAGNYMGMNFGVITEVLDTGISIEERVQDSAGVWVERSSSLQLQE